MRARPLALVAIAAVAIAGPTGADAAPKRKPISKKYSIQTPVPHPNPPTGPSCSAAPAPISEHGESLKVLGPGTLKVEVTNFQGDYDIGLYVGERLLAQGGGVDTPNIDMGTKETLTYKSKKAQTMRIDVCNFLGGPTADVKYTYTYS